MRKLFTLLALSSLMTACVKENIDEGKTAIDSSSNKICFACEEAAQGRLLVKLEAPTDEFCIEE